MQVQYFAYTTTVPHTLRCSRRRAPGNVHLLPPTTRVEGDEALDNLGVIVGVSELPPEEMEDIVGREQRTRIDEARLPRQSPGPALQNFGDIHVSRRPAGDLAAAGVGLVTAPPPERLASWIRGRRSAPTPKPITSAQPETPALRLSLSLLLLHLPACPSPITNDSSIPRPSASASPLLQTARMLRSLVAGRELMWPLTCGFAAVDGCRGRCPGCTVA